MAAYAVRLKFTARPMLVPLLLLALGECSAVPNMDATWSGCANRSGMGPHDEVDDPAGIPLEGITGLTPEQAYLAAAAKGHVVVFRVTAWPASASRRPAMDLSPRAGGDHWAVVGRPPRRSPSGTTAFGRGGLSESVAMVICPPAP